MAETTISQLRVNGETRDIADSWARQQLDSSGDHGHKIMDESGVIYPNRRKLKFINADVSDDAENDTTIVDINVTRFIEKPTVTVDDYEYDGTEQGPTIVGLTDDMVVRDAKKIEPGNYELVISLKNKKITSWADQTKSDIIVSYSIEKRKVIIPTVTGNYIYNTEEQECVIENMDSSLATVIGDTKATNAGTYNVTFDLSDKTKNVWSDGTDSIKGGSWVINKAPTTISADKTEIILDPTKLYDDVTFTVNGGDNREINVTVNEYYQTMIDVELLSGTTYRVTNKMEYNQRAEFRISSPATSNYESSPEYIIGVYSKMIPDLNDCTWEQISEISANGKASACWDVGDRKEIILNGKIGDYLTLNNEKYYVYIIGFNHAAKLPSGTSNETGITFGTFKIINQNYDVALIDDKYNINNKNLNSVKTFNINHWFYIYGEEDYSFLSYNYGGWEACDMRYDILGSTNVPPSNYGNVKTTDSVGYPCDYGYPTTIPPVSNTLLAAFPSDLRSVMKQIFKYVDYKGSSSSSGTDRLHATIEMLSLLSIVEISGSHYNDNIETDERIYEAQYDYFKNGNSTKKYYKYSNNEEYRSVTWYTRTPPYLNPSVDDKSWFIVSNEDILRDYKLNIPAGISPIFLV